MADLFVRVRLILADGTSLYCSEGMSSQYVGRGVAEAAARVGGMIRNGLIVERADIPGTYYNMGAVVRFHLTEIPLGEPRPVGCPALDVVLGRVPAAGTGDR